MPAFLKPTPSTPNLRRPSQPTLRRYANPSVLSFRSAFFGSQPNSSCNSSETDHYDDPNQSFSSLHRHQSPNQGSSRWKRMKNFKMHQLIDTLARLPTFA
ncbi:hypothetical protein OC861_000960 [Tilletia horrida]|nr:hypothetical protein OC845_000702 [Tilletia horrida]KAK0569472.1 hypothetical protein OC861_000960 [Tilletia horrida]